VAGRGEEEEGRKSEEGTAMSFHVGLSARSSRIDVELPPDPLEGTNDPKRIHMNIS
jgi:hypothetical protein